MDCEQHNQQIHVEADRSSRCDTVYVCHWHVLDFKFGAAKIAYGMGKRFLTNRATRRAHATVIQELIS